jgi:hypothetical protein
VSQALVRALNAEGIARFAAYLEALRSGSRVDPPRELLDDPDCTSDLSAQASLDAKPFASRWGIALVLSGPLHLESGIYQDITSRQDLLASRGVIEALNTLYLDRSRGMPKRGAQRTTLAPATIRRFVRVLQQLDLTYDIYGMSGAAILQLLPSEFDVWQEQRQVAR